MAIGFGSAPEKKVDETWTKEHGGRTYTFTKTRKGPDHFIYNCSRHIEGKTVTEDTSTGIVLDRELTHAEVESWKQFTDFMEGLT